MENLDAFGVNIEVERKIYANSLDMFVEIRGESFFSGKEAIKKAREVKEMVQVLSQVGIDENKIELMGVRMEVSSGMIGKSSSALYRLRVHLTNLESLGDVLGAVTSRKNASVLSLDWQYEAIDGIHDEMLLEAIEKAKNRAALICRELHLENLGVHTFTENFYDNQESHLESLAGGTPFMARKSREMTSEDLGLEVSHSKRISLSVRLECKVGPAAKP